MYDKPDFATRISETDLNKMPPKARVTLLALIGTALAFHFLPLIVPRRGLPTRDTTDTERKGS